MMANIIENLVNEETVPDDLKIILPDNWETKVVDKRVEEGNVKVNILVNVSTREDFQKWLKDYENITGTSYAIKSTDIKDGPKLILKQRYTCHHFTQCKKTYSPLIKNRTRNTNCPSKLYVKIHNHRQNYKGKRENYDLFRNMPCEITLTANHNHATGTVDSLRFRKVSDSVRDQLLGLYADGHTPTTALKIIQCDIQMNNDDYITVLADRNQCPSYKYCYNLFRKVFKTQSRSADFNLNAKAILQTKLQSYNKKLEDTSAKIDFIGQDSSDYVIGICTPIMKRVHNNVENASKIVFMDSSGKNDRDGSRIFVLLTDSECGALPLGLMITTSDSVEAIKCGFNILIELVGETIFGGHKEGPKVFITDDSLAEQRAVGDVWPGAKRFLCIFHVLQAVSRWLSESKNGIQKEHQTQIYNEFRKILYSVDLNEMTTNYEQAVENGKKYLGYINYLKNYWWPKRESWVQAYRNSGLIKTNHTNNNYAEITAIRQIQDNIFSRVKSLNLLQITDVLLTKFEKYNQQKLLDASNNNNSSRNNNFLEMEIKMLPAEIMKRIIKLDDHFVEVPSETKNDIVYLVNMEILLCSCMEGNTGSICKHIDWANMLYWSDSSTSRINSLKIRKKLYFIATGQAPKKGSLLPLISKTNSASSELSDFFIVLEEQSCSSEDLVLEQSENRTLNCTDINYPETKRKYEETMNKMTEIFNKHFEKSPLEVLKSVEKMCHTMKKLETPAAFSTAVLDCCESINKKHSIASHTRH